MSTDQTKNNADFYKETVFLPKTDFPMRGGLPDKEPEILKKWAEIDLYAKLRTQSQGRDQFILHDGPPYANGHIHAGTGLTKVLKDFVNRTHQMMGYDAPYVPGWDCHGLPIEWKIEEQYREQGKDKDDVDVLTFRDECRKFAQKFVDIQSEEFQRLGTVADWKNPYLTMTKGAEAGIVREIHKFLLNGSLYRGAKPVMWSVVEQTALAEAEVEYKEHKSIIVWIRFPVATASHSLLEGTDIVIWTTTPWTLPSNRAIAFGEDVEYGVYEVQSVGAESRVAAGSKIILATSLAEATREKAGIEGWSCLGTLKGSEIAGTVCKHPLNGQGYDFDVPAFPGDFVTEDAGTGFVHIAPGHGADDFYLGVKHGVEVTDNVTDDGVFRDHVPLFAGKVIYDEKGQMGDANGAVIKAMDEVGALLAKGSIRHDYPHSWRSKAPVIFRTTAQWFIALDDDNKLRERALQAVSETRWVPAQGQNRMRSMVEQRPDWCVSRQRAWGVPIAVFVSKETGEPLQDEDVLNRIAAAFEDEGSDAWWAREAQDFLGDKYDAEDYEQVFDIIDVWFESGSTHAFVLEQRPELSWPADVYFEGTDQHRGWFQSSLLESCGTRGRAPYNTVITNGFVLDEKGYKMSKSLGNTVAPQDVCNTQGADIFRLWAATSDYREDLRIGQDILKSSADLYRRVRNTMRFLLGALSDFTKEEIIPESQYTKMPELERLVLHKLVKIDKQMRQCIRDFDFPRMANLLHHFCAIDLSAFYFDIRKDRLYCDRPDLFERRACRTVMMHIFDALVTWWAPILCFTAEETWSHRPAGVFEDFESVHLRTYPLIPENWRDDALEDKWTKVQQVRRVVLGALEPKRADKTIGSSLEAHPEIFVGEAYKDVLEGVDLAEVCITSQVSLVIGDVPQGDDLFRLNEVPEVAVRFGEAEGQKCLRCWKILPEVGTDSDYPDLTLRDADAVRWYMQNRKAA